MSLLAGLGKGLVESGQAVGRNFAVYSQMLNEQERDKMRQASLEKRWAIDDKRYNDRMKKDDERDQKNDQRYADSKATEAERYKDTTKRYDYAANNQAANNSRLNERESVGALSSGIDRLDKIRADKEAQIREMFVDPMTKSIMDQEGYNAAMTALRDQYTSSAADLVQRSGLDESLVNKYGFSSYLPEQKTEQPVASDVIAPEPVTQMPDVSAFAEKIRQGANGDSSTSASSITPTDFAKLTPDQQKQRYQDLTTMRQLGVMPQPESQTTGLLDKIKRVW